MSIEDRKSGNGRNVRSKTHYAEIFPAEGKDPRERKRQYQKKSKAVLVWNVLLLLAGLAVMAAVLFNKVLPRRYQLMGGSIVLLFLLLASLARKHIWPKVLAFLLAALSCFALFYSQMKVNQVVAKKTTQTTRISYIVKMDSPISAIEQINGLPLGVAKLMDEALLNRAMESLASKQIIPSAKVEESSYLDLAKKLMDGSQQVILFDEAFRHGLEEILPDFSGATRVIYSEEKSFEKIVESKAGEAIVTPKPEIVIPGVGKANEGQPFILLISGMDVEGPITQRSRSDVNILMSVNPQSKKIAMASIPRDTYVPLDGDSGPMDKLTHAGNYGIASTMATISDYFDLPIHYYARFNFTSFINIIHVIGDITVDSKYDFVGYEGTHFALGTNTLNANQALEFARTRYTVPGGDVTRGIHQMEVISGIINKLTSPSNIMNVEGIVKAVSESLDTDFGSDAISKMINMMLSQPGSYSFSNMNLEGYGTMAATYSYGAEPLSVYVGDAASVEAIRNTLISNLEK